MTALRALKNDTQIDDNMFPTQLNPWPFNFENDPLPVQCRNGQSICAASTGNHLGKYFGSAKIKECMPHRPLVFPLQSKFSTLHGSNVNVVSTSGNPRRIRRVLICLIVHTFLPTELAHAPWDGLMRPRQQGLITARQLSISKLLCT